jgi:hypothetical protein
LALESFAFDLDHEFYPLTNETLEVHREGLPQSVNQVKLRI